MKSLPAPAQAVKHIAPSASIAFTMGAADAAKHDACCPEMIFTHIDDKRDYCAGYQSIAGPTLTTRQFLGNRS